jgi:protein ATS1
MIVYAAGSNAQGQLGTGNFDDAHTFTPCWFWTGTGDCLRSPPGRVLDIASGANHALAVMESNNPAGLRTLWGCGNGQRGQLGPILPLASSSSSGDIQLQAVWRPIDMRISDRVLGRDMQYDIRKIACCWETSYVVLSPPRREETILSTASTQISSDILVSMGADDFGDLGVGCSRPLNAVSGAETHIISFDHILPADYSRYDIVDVAAGVHHVLAQLLVTMPDGKQHRVVAGWGTCRHGQLGAALASPPRTTFEKAPKQPRSPAYVSVPHTITLEHTEPLVSTSLGSQHSVLLHATGDLTVLGSNSKGQLGGLHAINHPTLVGCTWNGTYTLSTLEGGSDTIFTTGTSSKGQLGRVLLEHEPIRAAPAELRLGSGILHAVKQLACGSEHVLVYVEAQSSIDQSPSNDITKHVLHRSPEVWGWGWNEHGNLGVGTTDDQHLPIRIWPPVSNPCPFRQVVNIWAGCGTSWIGLQ